MRDLFFFGAGGGGIDFSLCPHISPLPVLYVSMTKNWDSSTVLLVLHVYTAKGSMTRRRSADSTEILVKGEQLFIPDCETAVH